MDPSIFVYQALTSEPTVGPGCVIVDPAKATATYTAIDDVTPHDFQNTMRGEIERHPELVYVVSKSETHLHVFSYLRELAASQIANGELPVPIFAPNAQC
jgi:hypothetical protein